VVDRSRDVLDSLREEKAIEAKGGDSEPVQAVFDLSAGEFQKSSPASQSGAAANAADSEAAADGGEDTLRERFGEDADDVLDALTSLDVNETPPIELMAEVQELQEKLDGE
jgi:DNA mismatch repair protein MutS